MSRSNPNFRLSCPGPYILDPASGLCVEPPPVGFQYVNGQFVRSCVNGMRMNENGICIRQVVSRIPFSNEGTIQDTTIALGAQKTDGQSAVIYGTYDKDVYDLNFLNVQSAGSGSIEQIKLSEGSQGLFLVAQDNRTSNSENLQLNQDKQTFSGLSASTPINIEATQALANFADSIPESSVFKMDFLKNNNLMYFLGSPRTKIFLAEYLASNYKDKTIISTVPTGNNAILFTFKNEALSLSGTTDPYYVGSYNTLAADNGNLVLNHVGALQSGLDADLRPNEAEAPVSTTFAAQRALSRSACPAQNFIPSRPTDPFPQAFEKVSDATSRGFNSAALQGSKGYIMAGSINNTGSAFALRYLENDACTSSDPPARPITRQEAEIRLNLNANEGNIRVARFDVLQAGAPGKVDTIYAFGSDNSNNVSYGPVLSFVTEDHVYLDSNAVSFYFAAYEGSIPTLGPSNLYTFNPATLDAIGVATAFALRLTQLLLGTSAYAGSSINLDSVYFSAVPTLGQIKLDLVLGPGVPSLNYVVKASNSETSSLLGLAQNTNYIGSVSSSLVGPSAVDVNSLVGASYNGLSWDDTILNGSESRVVVNAMPVGLNGLMEGQNITAWSFEPVSQSLAFAIGNDNNVPSNNLGGSRLLQTVTSYASTDTSRRYQIPANTVNLEVYLWGAGGSSDSNAGGSGGAGAFVSGHLDRALWNPGDYLDIIVGSGGSAVLNTKALEGLGGVGASGIGRGGGRSAIQINGRDIVTAGGGGGSIGLGQGGAATADDVNAENGLPLKNGGFGATERRSGLGGNVYGDPRFSRSGDGHAYSGGSSTISGVSGPGGGSGYYGGGSGGYIGNTGNVNDVPTGGGGGSSFSSNLINPVLISGTRALAPNTNSNRYINGVARGGVRGAGLGGPGLVVIVATSTSAPLPIGASWTAPTGQSQGQQIWACAPNAMQVLPMSAFGSVGSSVTNADWTSMFTNISLNNTNISSLNNRGVIALFSGLNGLVVAVTESSDGSICGPPGASNYTYSNVWWTILPDNVFKNINTREAFGPIDYESSDGKQKYTVEPLSNVTSIRLLEAGSRDLVFIGDGIRIVTPPLSANGSWSNQRFVIDSDTYMPLDLSVTITDSQFNDMSSSVELTGKLTNFGITSRLQSPWSPIFASFYNPIDYDSAGALTPLSDYKEINSSYEGSIYHTYNPEMKIAVLEPSVQAPNGVVVSVGGPICDPVQTLSKQTIATKLLQPIPAIGSKYYIDFSEDATNGFTWNLFDAQKTLVLDLYHTETAGPFSQTHTPNYVNLYTFTMPTNAPSNSFLKWNYKLTSSPLQFNPTDIFHFKLSRLDGTLISQASVQRSELPGEFDPSYQEIVQIFPYTAGEQIVLSFQAAYDSTSASNISVMIEVETDNSYDTILTANPIRSGANILVSEDLGASFRYAESLLGQFLRAKNNSDFIASNFCLTGLDAFHNSSTDNAIGPATFPSLRGSLINAAVAQFNDIKFFDITGSNAAGLPYSGFFIAVGQFLWELNAMLSPAVQWPSNYTDLNNVAWVSLDGFNWTTIPIRCFSNENPPDLFWMVYKVDFVDPVGAIGTISTDVGLYKFDVQKVYAIILDLFYNGPITDFGNLINATNKSIVVEPIGRTGPFALECVARDPTGTCIKCLESGAQPVSIPQIIGEGGVIRPNVDVCLSKPDGLTSGYSALEGYLDSYAISAYAGYEIPGQARTVSSKMVSDLKQSFYSENANGDSLIICPLHTDTRSTPSSVNGNTTSAFVSNLMECQLDPGMQQPESIKLDGANTNGIFFVRRQGLKDPAIDDGLINIDNSYDGLSWQKQYARELRHLTMAPFDTFNSSQGQPLFLPDTCPATAGVGGSLVPRPPAIGDDSLYPTPGTDTGIRPSLLAKITNQGFNNGAISRLDGPFKENALIDVGGDWDPKIDFNRAVLANIDDTLDQFEYQTLAGGPNGVIYSYDGIKQEKNPKLLKLSSFEFPFDGSSKGNPDIITIGRDPQVYEPGFGPLNNYIQRDHSPGWAASEFNSARTPWPANPLPQEGFGFWWIRPENNPRPQNIVMGAFQAALGYGTLQFKQSLPADHSYALQKKDFKLFQYDTSKPMTETVNNYLNSGWTSFLPFNGARAGNINPSLPKNMERSNRAQYSIQNLLSLKLRNSPDSMNINSSSNNWCALVALNFFRPRNWSFGGLNFGSDGLVAQTFIGNGVLQQVLMTDQPSDGKYEFLIPDPFYAQYPMMALPNGTIAGNLAMTGPSDPDVGNITALFAGLPSFTIIECSLDTLGYADKHRAFHYWTYGPTGPHTLDIYINIQSLFAAIGTNDFSWNLGTIDYTNANFLGLFLTYFTASRSQNSKNLMATILNFDANPLNNFVWNDPSTQTTRSLQSMKQEGLEVVMTKRDALTMILLSEAGFAKRRANVTPFRTDYDITMLRNLLHYQFKVGPIVPGLAPNYILQNSNASAPIAFSGTSGTGGTGSTISANAGFIPYADPRGFTFDSNYQMPTDLINVKSSDYNVETDNSAYFAFGSSKIVQNLLAQDPVINNYGDPVYGFGLRIDSDAVKPADQNVSLTNGAALPADHGYVSMVRTTVDSHERFQLSSVDSIDPSPHVTRLTYVTKYVPSNLKNFGAIVQMPAMRLLNAANSSTLDINQNLLNPFKPRWSYLVENIPLEPWTRSRSVPGVSFYSIRSDYYDHESPGYWGRQALPLNVTIASTGPNVSLAFADSTYFDAFSYRKNAIYDNSVGVALAGYEGLLDGSTIDAATPRPTFSFRTREPIVQNGAYDPGVNQSAYIAEATENVVVGQMLIDLNDAFDVSNPPEAVPYVGPVAYFSIKVNVPGFSATFTDNVSLQFFMHTYVTMPSGLVNHKECADIIAEALAAWLTAKVQSNTNFSSVDILCSAEFEVGTDRADFTFSTNNPATNTFSQIRLYLPSPLSNWLGLRPVTPPMFDLSRTLNTTNPDLGDSNEGIDIAFEYDFGYNGNYNSDFGASVYRNDYWKTFVQNALGDSFSSWISPVDYVSVLFNLYQTTLNDINCYGGSVFPPSLSRGGKLTSITFDGVKYTVSFRNDCETYGYFYFRVNNGRSSTALSDWVGFGATRQDNGGGQSGADNTYNSPNINIQSDANYKGPECFWSPAGWISNYSNGPKASEFCWTTYGWTSLANFIWGINYPNIDKLTDATVSSPMYSMFFETNTAPKSSITFRGRTGFDSTGAVSVADYSLFCDISNASWTTRLNNGIESRNPANTGNCVHSWGLSAPSAVSLASSINLTHCDSILVAKGTFEQQVQTPVNMQPYFMSDTANNSTTVLVGSIPTRASFCLDGIALPALQLPCPFGSSGNYPSPIGPIINRPTPKPSNYSALVPYDILGPISASGLTNSNYNYTTRDTSNILGLVTADDNFVSFQILNPKTNLVPAPGNAKGANAWPAPLIAPASPPVNVQPDYISNACGEAVLFIKDKCIVNIAPTVQNILDTSATTRLALYAFNYTDLYLPNTLKPYSALQSNTFDITKNMRSYMRCKPYYIDEGYDSALFSSLGRSFQVDAQRSSLTGALLVPTAIMPVILILAPATGSDSIIGGNSVSTIKSYSNSMMYSFTEPYARRQLYTLTFTTVANGPLFAFYGLDNMSNSGIRKASNTTGTMARKIYYDLGSAGALSFDSNDCAVDVRQVYTPQSLMITTEGSDPYAPGAAKWTNLLTTSPITYSFNTVTLENPNWALRRLTNDSFLPLAGTWASDSMKNSLNANNRQLTLSQSVPNYEGLSLVSEWISTVDDLPIFDQWVVDRLPAVPSSRNATYFTSTNAFDLRTLEAYRPQTLFVLLCDIWRNTIRTPQRFSSEGVYGPGGAASTLPIKFDFVDCMGPSDYDATDNLISQYFGMCNGTFAIAKTVSKPAVIGETPWASNNQIWSPFTGGSFWNSFERGSNATMTDPNRYAFSTDLWWPTYKWLVGKTDPNNVWASSIKTNPKLEQSNYFIVSATDGTIRKLYLPIVKKKGTVSEETYPIVESTTRTTFYNDGVNLPVPDKVFSYSAPGRLYNLTWWANNWWCTSDAASVYTTAPLNDENQTPINDGPVVENFIASIIQFRPLSLSEGMPANWVSAHWPSNKAHKFNVMKIINYKNASALFVGNVDGEYTVITQDGTRFSSQIVQSEAFTFGLTSYVTDIATIDNRLVVGSLPLPLDPAVESVPWFSGGPLELDFLSLSSGPGLDNLMASKHETWPDELTSSNVLSTIMNLPYDQEKTVIQTMADLTSQMTTLIIGSNGTASTFTNGIYVQGLRPTGLKRLYNSSPLPNDNLPFYATAITDAKVRASYGLMVNPGNVATLGNTILALQYLTSINSADTFPVGTGSVTVPIFLQGGLDFNRITKAFFVIDSGSAYSSGIKDFRPTTTAFVAPAPTGNLMMDTWSIVAVMSGSNIITAPNINGISPMWADTFAYQVKLKTLDQGAYEATIIKPEFGPLSDFKKYINDYDELRLFQNIDILRITPIPSNLSISCFALAPEVSALAYTSTSPFSGLRPVIATIGQDGSLDAEDINPAYVAYQTEFVSKSIIEWNPYELKWYAAGLATNIPDWNSPDLDPALDISILRPSGFPVASWPTSPADLTHSVNDKNYVPARSTDTRFLIVSADASAGAVVNGNAVDFKIVYAKTGTKMNMPIIKPVSDYLDGATCMGFSPTIAAICGFNGANAALVWRTNTTPAGNDLGANWTYVDLGIPGRVSAIKYVGYAWYIAVWNPNANVDHVNNQSLGQSTLLFASINFNALSPLDSWSVNQLYEIKTIDSVASIGAQPGFEPDANNPNQYLKICPGGFKAFGSLCVQKCLAPFSETTVPNECRPDTIKPRTVSPTANGQNVKTIPFDNVSNRTTVENSINYINLGLYAFVILCVVMIILGIFIKGNVKNFFN